MVPLLCTYNVVSGANKWALEVNSGRSATDVLHGQYREGELKQCHRVGPADDTPPPHTHTHTPCYISYVTTATRTRTSIACLIKKIFDKVPCDMLGLNNMF
jgi:hypothetical protein